ncbi:hypothetical protein ACS0TY_006438 [Phlomoides rotata]
MDLPLRIPKVNSSSESSRTAPTPVTPADASSPFAARSAPRQHFPQIWTTRATHVIKTRSFWTRN